MSDLLGWMTERADGVVVPIMVRFDTGLALIFADPHLIDLTRPLAQLHQQQTGQRVFLARLALAEVLEELPRRPDA